MIDFNEVVVKLPLFFNRLIRQDLLTTIREDNHAPKLRPEFDQVFHPKVLYEYVFFCCSSSSCVLQKLWIANVWRFIFP